MEKAFQQFGFAVGKYIDAIKFIFQNNLSWFFIFPVVFAALLFLGASAGIANLQDYIQTSLNIENADFFGAAILASIISIIVWVVSFFIIAYFGGYIILIVMSPILAIVSEKTEKIYTGKQYPTDPDQIMRDIIRGIRLAIRNLFKELFWIIAVFFITLILGIIPVIGWIIGIFAPIFLFIVASYYYGFSFMDYVNERRKLNFRESINFVKQNKGLAIGNGFIFSIVLLVPILGAFLSSFFAIISVVAATLSVLELEKQEKINLPQTS